MNSKSYYSAKTADKHQEISPPIHEIHVTLIRENNVFFYDSRFVLSKINRNCRTKKNWVLLIPVHVHCTLFIVILVHISKCNLS